VSAALAHGGISCDAEGGHYVLGGDMRYLLLLGIPLLLVAGMILRGGTRRNRGSFENDAARQRHIARVEQARAESMNRMGPHNTMGGW
jgi:hypothetical protein